ncbi:hypothetical protein CKA32_006042 [Geitlerinema sp. FC II]|nr:hypothetical protein CKA32_006042 [Geitlerinema sp. FC II]
MEFLCFLENENSAESRNSILVRNMAQISVNVDMRSHNSILP